MVIIVALDSPNQTNVRRSENLKDSDTCSVDLKSVTALSWIRFSEDEVIRKFEGFDIRSDVDSTEDKNES